MALNEKRAMKGCKGLSEVTALNAIHELVCCLVGDSGTNPFESICEKLQELIDQQRPDRECITFKFCDPADPSNVYTKKLYYNMATSPPTLDGELFFDPTGAPIDAFPEGLELCENPPPAQVFVDDYCLA